MLLKLYGTEFSHRPGHINILLGPDPGRVGTPDSEGLEAAENLHFHLFPSNADCYGLDLECPPKAHH